MNTWSLETVARRAVSWAFTPAAVAAHGVLEALWPKRYEPHDVPDTWLDTYEEENETLEPREDTWRFSTDDVQALRQRLWEERVPKTFYECVACRERWADIDHEHDCPSLSSVPVRGADGSGGADTTPPPEPPTAQWLEPAIITELAAHTPLDNPCDDLVACVDGPTQHVCKDFAVGDWQSWYEHVAPRIAARIVRALKARAGAVS